MILISFFFSQDVTNQPSNKRPISPEYDTKEEDNLSNHTPKLARKRIRRQFPEACEFFDITYTQRM